MHITHCRALVTNNGYCVKAVIEGTTLVFFTDFLFNHRVWRATENNPTLLIDIREYHRLRDTIGLKEIELNPDDTCAINDIAVKVLKDPYYGFSKEWRRKNNIPQVWEVSRISGSENVLRYTTEKPIQSEKGNLGALLEKFNFA
jgi:hypothetical protein